MDTDEVQPSRRTALAVHRARMVPSPDRPTASDRPRIYLEAHTMIATTDVNHMISLVAHGGSGAFPYPVSADGVLTRGDGGPT